MCNHLTQIFKTRWDAFIDDLYTDLNARYDALEAACASVDGLKDPIPGLIYASGQSGLVELGNAADFDSFTPLDGLHEDVRLQKFERLLHEDVRLQIVERLLQEHVRL